MKGEMPWKAKNAVIAANAKGTAKRATPRRVTAAATVAVLAPAAKNSLTISRAAALADVNVETIRYYEREGLISQPPRPASGYRLYPSATVNRIRFIKHCQELGFSLNETREFLRMQDLGTSDCDEACEKVGEKIQELTAKISALQHLRENLQSMLGTCPEGHCRVMEALNPDAPLSDGCSPVCASGSATRSTQ